MLGRLNKRQFIVIKQIPYKNIQLLDNSAILNCNLGTNRRNQMQSQHRNVSLDQKMHYARDKYMLSRKGKTVVFVL